MQKQKKTKNLTTLKCNTSTPVLGAKLHDFSFGLFLQFSGKPAAGNHSDKKTRQTRQVS